MALDNHLAEEVLDKDRDTLNTILEYLPSVLAADTRPLFCGSQYPIPGVPMLDEKDLQYQYTAKGRVIRSPWGIVEDLWGTDSVPGFSPLYRLIAPAKDIPPIPPPRIPVAAKAWLDGITGLVTVIPEEASDQEQEVHFKLDLRAVEETRTRYLRAIRRELARMGIPLYPVELIRRNSAPYPWESSFRTPQIANKEVAVPLVGYATDEGELVYVHMAGPRAAVRSVWATMCKNGREKRLLLSTRADQYTVYATHNYASFSSPLSNGDMRLILIDRRAIEEVPTASAAYFVTNASSREEGFKQFAGRLNNVLPVPVLPDWGEWLYLKAARVLVNNLVVGGDVTGACRINPDPERWIALIRSGIQSGELSV
jgi:hypothetical protein